MALQAGAISQLTKEINMTIKLEVGRRLMSCCRWRKVMGEMLTP